MHWKGRLRAASLALLLAAAAGAGGAAAREPTPDLPLPRACGYDRAAMLAMAYDNFDQDPAEGWRPLADRPGCELAAAEVLAAYRNENKDRVTDGQRRTLLWHEGQLRAAVGQTAFAIDLLDLSRAGDPFVENVLYADATIAFLRHDRRALLKARAALAAVPMPPTFAADAARAKMLYGFTVTWPPNLAVVDRLIACFGRPYIEAYGGACQGTKARRRQVPARG